ncbi:MAG TPA: arylesterase [Steroidobacteraceae bacterium]|nr:arylesterase [Steroidobacteraceae bacterium]
MFIDKFSARSCKVLLAIVAMAMCFAAQPQTRDAPAILVMGDSLSAGYGLKVESGWVALLQQRLAKEGYEYHVVNASVSGETTGGARTRFPRSLQLHRPQIVIIELGGNDGLRGLPIAQMKANLQAMIQAARDAQAKVLLLGMNIPPNYGPEYANQFHRVYVDLANQYQLPLVDFFLKDVALMPQLMQADGIHPTAEAQSRLLANVWPVLLTLLPKRR